MQIGTSDVLPVVVNSFEGVQEVVRRMQRTAVMQSIASKESSNQVTYGGHSIQTDDTNALRDQIPNVLDDMSLYSFRGKIYSGDQNVFEDNFAQCLNLLLIWLASMQLVLGAVFQVGVTALVMKSALEWVKLTMERVGVRSDDDIVRVEEAIKQL
jgi:hypothetical protein